MINELDAHLYGTYPETTPGLNSYWESLYHHKFDGKPPSNSLYSVYHSFVRISVSHVLGRGIENQSKLDSDCFVPDKLKLNEVFVHYENDQFVGYVTRFERTRDGTSGTGSIFFESLFVPVDHQVTGDTDTCPKLRSASVEVRTLYNIVYCTCGLRYGMP